MYAMFTKQRGESFLSKRCITELISCTRSLQANGFYLVEYSSILKINYSLLTSFKNTSDWRAPETDEHLEP